MWLHGRGRALGGHEVVSGGIDGSRGPETCRTARRQGLGHDMNNASRTNSHDRDPVRHLMVEAHRDRRLAYPLSRDWLGSAVQEYGPGFLTYILTLMAILWAVLARGAFYKADLIGLLVLSVASIVSVLPVYGSLAAARWWLVTATVLTAGMLVSATAQHDLRDVGYALAPVVIVASLGIVGASVGRQNSPVLLLRIIVYVMSFVALLAWLGVAFHLGIWAQPLHGGWRASATIGYANVAALLLLIGLLCACGLAIVSTRASDEVCCWILATGLLATQSRSAVVAMSLCGLILVACCRSMAKVLGLSVAWAAVAFAGLLPSIRDVALGAPIAIASATLSLALLLLNRRSARRRPIQYAAVFILPIAAAIAAIALLHSRIFDKGSNQGRIELWRSALARLRSTGVFGDGPHQLADLSRGESSVILVHNDYLQYAEYYGMVGLVAATAIAWRLARQLARCRAKVEEALWATAMTVTAAVAVVALVDFPLQVPAVPAITSLVLGCTIGAGIKQAAPT